MITIAHMLQSLHAHQINAKLSPDKAVDTAVFVQWGDNISGCYKCEVKNGVLLLSIVDPAKIPNITIPEGKPN